MVEIVHRNLTIVNFETVFEIRRRRGGRKPMGTVHEARNKTGFQSHLAL